jgi:hypothetical protein
MGLWRPVKRVILSHMGLLIFRGSQKEEYSYIFFLYGESVMKKNTQFSSILPVSPFPCLLISSSTTIYFCVSVPSELCMFFYNNNKKLDKEEELLS